MLSPACSTRTSQFRLRTESLHKVFLSTLYVTLAASATFAVESNRAAAPLKPKQSVERLLVIAPSRFLPALEKFMRHKSELLDATVKPLEEVLAGSQGVDDAEKLKRYLYANWREHGLDFVLLVGDVDVLPVRYMTLDRKQKTAFNHSFYPSDLYYSDLAKQDGSFENWNAQQDSFHAGYFGEVHGETNKDGPINYDAVDYQPEIAVGRWPVSSPENVARLADKTVRYERQVLAGESTHLHRAAMVSVGGWVDSRSWMDHQAEKLQGWQIEKRYFSNRSRSGKTPPPSREEIRGVFNQGVGLMIHAGHGQTDMWEQCFLMSDVDRIHNADALPIIVSAGCSTANFAPLPPYGPYLDVHGDKHRGTDRGETFDAPPPPPANYQAGNFNPSGLGEQLVQGSENGAVAYIGCNTGSQPCALSLVDGFVSALATAKQPRLGACWSQAIVTYYQDQRLATLAPDKSWYPPSIFFQPMKFMLFGDPSLLLPANGEREQ